MRLITVICLLLPIFTGITEAASVNDVFLDFSFGFYRTSSDVEWPKFILRYNSNKSHVEEVDESTLNSYNAAIGGTTALFPRVNATLRGEYAYFPSIQIDYVNTYHKKSGTYHGEISQFGYSLGLTFLLFPRQKETNFYLSADLATSYTFFSGDIAVEKIIWDKKLDYVIPGCGLSYRINKSFRLDLVLQYRLNYDSLGMSGPLFMVTLHRKLF